MITFDVAQGTTEWADLRLGIPTASQFHRIITPKTLKVSGQAADYAYELLAELVMGEPMDNATSGFMNRGTIQEHKAVQFYELQLDVETESVGFVLRDDRRVGCSPDRFVGPNGLLEVKCPAADTHIKYLLADDGIGADYRCQMQGQLWLCEREWLDSLSYNPLMPPALVRVTRDEDFIKALSFAVERFLEQLEGMKETLSKRGLPQLEPRALLVA